MNSTKNLFEIELNQTTLCSQCNKDILNRFETYLEFGNLFYHKDCFKCKTCSKEFSFQQDKFDLFPISDSYGVLYCNQDFISTLECKLCNKNFDSNSNIFRLNETDSIQEDSEILVHVGCAKCNSCQKTIEISSEYVIINQQETNSIFLTCKNCTFAPIQKPIKNKCMKSVNHRLSSRQKELLAFKILANNVDVEKLIFNQDNILLEKLSIEIKCSPKSLMNYLNKHLKKNKASFDAHHVNKLNSIKEMLEDLKRLDKVLAPPNKYPFSNQVTAKNGISNNILTNATNSLLNF